MKIIIFFLFLSLWQFSFCQETKTDSLLRAVSKGKTDTVSAKTYFKLAAIYMDKGIIDSGNKYIRKGYNISKKLNFIKGLAVSSNILGRIHNLRGDLDSALFYFTKAKYYYDNVRDSVRSSGMLNNLGVTYKAKGNILKAMDCYFKSLKIKERLKDSIGVANGYANIGLLYSELNDTANTIKYARLALQLREKINDEAGMSSSFMAVGIYYQSMGNSEFALIYLKKGIELSEKLGDEEAIAIGSYNLANIYYKQHKTEICIQLYKRALSLSQKNNNAEGSATCLEVLGQISMDKNETAISVKLLEEAYNVASETGIKELMSSISFKLSEAYERTGNYKKAFTYHKISSDLKDSLFNRENIRKLTGEGIKYEHEKEKIILEKEQEKKEAIAKAESFKKDIIIIASVLFLLVVSVFCLIIFKRLKENRKQKNIIEQQRNEMVDSINYAKRIQFALLAQAEFLKENLPSHFVFFQPKDIVSGDFYWATIHNGYCYLAVCDSTGHGVPGAFMCLLNISFLNEAINEKNISSPAAVLDHVRERLIKNMDGGQDGMDAVLIRFKCITSGEPIIKKIEYAAANNAPVLIRDSTIIRLPKDKMPVGKGEIKIPFTLHTLDLKKNDHLFLYTDGFADQFGGPKGKKFKDKNLNELLVQISDKVVNNQQPILKSTIDNWKGNFDQVDDICIVGIKI